MDVILCKRLIFNEKLNTTQNNEGVFKLTKQFIAIIYGNLLALD